MKIIGNLETGSLEGITKLSGLQRYKTQRKKEERITIAASTTKNLATLTGAGTVSNIWMTMENQDRNAHLKIYVDGETDPSIDIDLATLFMSNFCKGTTDSTTKFFWSTQNMHGEGGEYNSQGGYITFPIPYRNGCVIDVVTVEQITYFYYMVDWIPNFTSKYRLKSISRSYSQNPQVYASGDSLDLWQTPTAAEGWLVYLSYIAAGTAPSYLERNFEFYHDGEGTASHISSGTEDAFFGSYYWQSKQQYYTPIAALSYYANIDSLYKTAVAVDLMALNGMGMYFSSNLRLKLPTEGNVGVGHSAGHLSLFYTTDTSGWINPTTTTTTSSTTTTTTVAGGTTVISDTFTAANSATSVSARTPSPTNTPGNTWAVSGSGVTFGITSNKAYQSAGDNSVEGFAIINTGLGNGDFSVDITTGPNTDRTLQGLVLRSSAAPATDSLRVVILSVSGAHQMELNKVVAGVQTTIGTYAFSVATNTTYAVRAVVSGTSITVYLDGVSRITYNTSTGLESNTYAGIFTYHQTGFYDDLTGTWDNFLVKT